MIGTKSGRGRPRYKKALDHRPGRYHLVVESLALFVREPDVHGPDIFLEGIEVAGAGDRLPEADLLDLQPSP